MHHKSKKALVNQGLSANFQRQKKTVGRYYPYQSTVTYMAQEEGYSPMAKIFRSATGEQALRWLTLKYEPHSATQRVAEGR